MEQLRRVRHVLSSLLAAVTQGFVRTSAVKPYSERPHLSVWEARDVLRANGVRCSAEDVALLIRRGKLEAYKYHGRWRVTGIERYNDLSPFMRKQRGA